MVVVVLSSLLHSCMDSVWESSHYEVSSTGTRYALAPYELEVKYIRRQGLYSLTVGLNSLRSSRALRYRYTTSLHYLTVAAAALVSIAPHALYCIVSPRARGSVLDNGGVVVASS